MNFQPLNPMASPSSTWNVDHLLTHHSQSLLLPDGRFDFLHYLKESDCIESLGQEYNDWDNEGGHTKEWYYLAPSGSLVGVAFRYGCARLRGDSRTTVADVVEFIDYLQQAVKK